MMRLASIDVGTNAMRLEIADVPENIIKKVTPKEEFLKKVRKSLSNASRVRIPCRLGIDVFNNGFISDDKIEEAIVAFEYFHDEMNSQNVDYYLTAATSAAREAVNGGFLAQRIEENTGINFRLVHAEEENRLVNLALLPLYKFDANQQMFVDVGGGSVEVSVQEKENILFQDSYKLGTIRLMILTHNNEHKMKVIIEQSLLPVKKFFHYNDKALDLFFTIGGNADDLVVLGQKYFHYDIGSGSGRHIPLELLDAMLTRLQEYPAKLRAYRFNLRPDRADVIYQAGIVFKTLGEYAGIKYMHVPNANLTDGIILDLIYRLQREYIRLGKDISISPLHWNIKA